MAYPSTLSSFTYPSASDKLNNPSHSALHNTVASAVGQVEAFVGTLSSVQGTLMYDVRAAASDGGGHVQTAAKGGTGQTTFTKGDILVAQSSSVITKVAVGTVNGYALVVDSSQPTGVKWGTPGNVPSLFAAQTASVFTYVKPSVFSFLKVTLVGGGGGYGGGTFGGPGGGGAYATKIIPASSVAANVTIVVGAAGPAASVGGTTAFGSIFTAAGGAKGGDDPGSGGTSSGGSGGTASGGDINISGFGAGSQARSGAASSYNTPGGDSPAYTPWGRGASGVGNASGGMSSNPGGIIIETY